MFRYSCKELKQKTETENSLHLGPVRKYMEWLRLFWRISVPEKWWSSWDQHSARFQYTLSGLPKKKTCFLTPDFFAHRGGWAGSTKSRTKSKLNQEQKKNNTKRKSKKRKSKLQPKLDWIWAPCPNTPHAYDKRAPNFAQGVDFVTLFKGEAKESQRKKEEQK